ncbi:hypothetical protein Y1Q_0001950 [Alligator mississippiensis]|uniref:Uncharacterized protein n=1 Tax=Alligator mississippiensis TaxID=8496 RepID=A0A151PGA4_ALLMI|nr:hypothetical protein Y1Q_0001950 [Alligator mississippiensis]
MQPSSWKASLAAAAYIQRGMQPRSLENSIWLKTWIPFCQHQTSFLDLLPESVHKDMLCMCEECVANMSVPVLT